MHPAVRVVIAVVCGALAAFAVVAGVENLGQRIVALPAGIDLYKPGAFEKLPLAALFVVVAAWIVATFVGGVVAGFIARRRVMFASAFVGIVVLVATVANFVMIPHPTWMVVAGIAGIVIAAMMAGRVMARRRRLPR